MSSEFCDWVPCTSLQRLVDTLVPRDRPSRVIQLLVYVPKTNPLKAPLKRVHFAYCPFCGTRIEGNKEVLDWIDKRIGEPSGESSTGEVTPWSFSLAVRRGS